MSFASSPEFRRRAARLACAAIAAITLAGCAAVDRTGRAFWQPYRPNTQQGNWVTHQQVAQLRPGMNREQVRFVLGTPTLTPVFRAERWDYPYFLKPGYGDVQERRFTVFFENDVLVRWEGDPQPNVQPFQQAREGREQFSPLPVPGATVQAGTDELGVTTPGMPPSDDAGDTLDAPATEGAPDLNVRNPLIQLQRSPTIDPAGVPSTGRSGSGTVPLR